MSIVAGRMIMAFRSDPPIVESVTITNAGTNTGTFTMNMPATRPDNDLYIAVVCKDGTGATTSPAGWTNIIDQSSGGGLGGQRLTIDRRIGSSEPASYDWTDAGTEQWRGCIYRLSGINTTTPIHLSAFDTGGSANGVAPTITPTIENTLIIRCISVDTAEVTATSGIADMTGQSSATSGVGAGASHAPGPPANGATGTATFTHTNETWVSATLAVAKAL